MQDHAVPNMSKKFGGASPAPVMVGAPVPCGQMVWIPLDPPEYPLEWLRYVYQHPIVPAVSRADFRKLEGVISSDAVLNKYRVISKKKKRRKIKSTPDVGAGCPSLAGVPQGLTGCQL